MCSCMELVCCFVDVEVKQLVPVKVPSSATDSHLSKEQRCRLRVSRRCRVARQRVEFCLKATLVRCRCLSAGKYNFNCSVLRILGCIVCVLQRTEVFHCLQTRCICLWVPKVFFRTMPDKMSLDRCAQSACAHEGLGLSKHVAVTSFLADS